MYLIMFSTRLKFSLLIACIDDTFIITCYLDCCYVMV